MCKAGSAAALLIVALAALAYAVPARLFHRTIRVYSDPEAYRVYAAILPYNLAYKRAPSSVIIRERTRSYDRHAFGECFSPGSKYAALVDPAIADYRRVNRSQWKLTRLFPVSKPYELAPETDFAGLWVKPSSPLGERIRHYPEFSGIVELSAVGFNRDKTIAVVYMAYTRTPLSSGWDMEILRKQQGEWRQLIGRGLECLARS